jgi:hypothetical protein
MKIRQITPGLPRRMEEDNEWISFAHRQWYKITGILTVKEFKNTGI